MGGEGKFGQNWVKLPCSFIIYMSVHNGVSKCKKSTMISITLVKRRNIDLAKVKIRRLERVIDT